MTEDERRALNRVLGRLEGVAEAISDEHPSAAFEIDKCVAIISDEFRKLLNGQNDAG